MTFKNILAVVAISATTAIASVWGYGEYKQQQYAGMQESGKLPVNYAGFFGNNNAPTPVVDFTPAATTATPAVVHIKTKTKARQVSNNTMRQRNPFSDLFGDDFGDFFGGPRMIPEQRASGSGVLITDDGYIVTNNHVVDNADEINVTLANKKSYKATVVGTDPSSDLAVIKVEGKGLPYLVYGNSDDVKLGQWVLAIGYPLTLDVTVTAGIVSAKSRSININARQSSSPVESFIQTDAAVNPGNSGGALINTNGELVGINSAIASPTGSYAGYSYAIPVNIVKKIITDIVKFGIVQRAYLGIKYIPEGLNEMQEKANDEKYGSKWRTTTGIFISEVTADGAAVKAGLKEEDVLTKINNQPVNTISELQDQLTRYKPGDNINITYLRAGKEYTATLTLRNESGNTDVVKVKNMLEGLGADLVTGDSKTLKANQLEGGVVVRRIYDNGLFKKTRIQEGFIITAVNDEAIRTVEDLEKILSRNRGRKVKVEGVYPGYENTYPYPLDLSGLN
jgi:serine protease Do